MSCTIGTYDVIYLRIYAVYLRMRTEPHVLFKKNIFVKLPLFSSFKDTHREKAP